MLFGGSIPNWSSVRSGAPNRVTSRSKSSPTGNCAISWIITGRLEAYYAWTWRATWKGERPVRVINQCLHQLDMLQWLLGMPARARARLRAWAASKIEVEMLTAYMEFPERRPARLFRRLAEAPGTNRLEISGDMGKLPLEIAETGCFSCAMKFR